MTDEIMYEIMKLSGQEYVDEYAQRAKVSLPLPRRHRGPGTYRRGHRVHGRQYRGRRDCGTPSPRRQLAAAPRTSPPRSDPA